MSSNKRTSKVKNGILIAVVIAFLIAIIGGTYARFVSGGIVSTSTDIAKWHIVLGGTEDISLESKTITVPAQDVGTNQNIANGKLAPGKTVVATFKVDPTGSEVAVDYLMNVDLSNVSEFSNSELEISNIKYTLEGTNIEEDMFIDDETGNYIFEEELNDVLAGKEVTFKIYITWTESTDLGRSLADTEKAVNIDNILIPVNIVARQHIGDSLTKCTVTFKDEETTLLTETVTKGKTVTKPTDPIKEDYDFVNWYSDSELTTEYDFTTAITGNTIIYAKWEEAITGPTIKFSDGIESEIVNSAKSLASYYTNTVHSDFFSSVAGVNWQLFYDDANYIYLIASDYVENSKLPANGNAGYGSTDLVKTSGANADYNAAFCSNTNHNNGVLTSGTIYKSGSESTAIANNRMTNTYLRWVGLNSSSKNTNIQAVAYMMDTNKWSSFAGNKYENTIAIGGPTIELFVKSWNAYPEHSTNQLGTYDTMTSGTNYNANGYKAWNISKSSWENCGESGDLGTTTNMWCDNSKTKAEGYWLASPSSRNNYDMCWVDPRGFLYYSRVSDVARGFRPIVSIPKSSIQ